MQVSNQQAESLQSRFLTHCTKAGTPKFFFFLSFIGMTDLLVSQQKCMLYTEHTEITRPYCKAQGPTFNTL